MNNTELYHGERLKKSVEKDILEQTAATGTKKAHKPFVRDILITLIIKEQTNLK